MLARDALTRGYRADLADGKRLRHYRPYTYDSLTEKCPVSAAWRYLNARAIDARKPTGSFYHGDVSVTDAEFLQRPEARSLPKPFTLTEVGKPSPKCWPRIDLNRCQ